MGSFFTVVETAPNPAPVLADTCTELSKQPQDSALYKRSMNIVTVTALLDIVIKWKCAINSSKGITRNVVKCAKIAIRGMTHMYLDTVVGVSNQFSEVDTQPRSEHFFSFTHPTRLLDHRM